MPILHSGSGLVAARTNILKLQGTLQLQFTAVENGTLQDETRFVSVNSNSLSSSNPILIPPAETTTTNGYRYNGFRLLGTSKAFTAASGATNLNGVPGGGTGISQLGAIMTGFYQTPGAPTFSIVNGFGKLDIAASETVQNVKDVSDLIGLTTTAAATDVYGNAVIFARAAGTGTSTQNFTADLVGGTAATIRGGVGTALATSLLNLTTTALVAAGATTVAFTAVTGVTADSLIGRNLVFGGVEYEITDNTTTQITLGSGLESAIASGTTIDVVDPEFIPTTLRLDSLEYGPFTFAANSTQRSGIPIAVSDAIRLQAQGNSVIFT